MIKKGAKVWPFLLCQGFNCDTKYTMTLGGAHKLRLQEEGVGGQKNRLFVNFYTIENVM